MNRLNLLAMTVTVLFLAGCAASPERKRGEEQLIDASYADFDCAALAIESERLLVEMERAGKAAKNPAQYVPIVNIFTLGSTIKGINDLEAAKARQAGVERAQAERGCAA